MRNWTMTRRSLLVAAGSGVLGVTVLNTVTACSAGGTPAPAPAPPPGSAPGDTSGAVAGDWRRVNLSFVSAYLLIRGNEAAVVDLGTAGSADAIGSALQAAGSGWPDVKHIIVTHKHPDHAGGLAGVAPRVTATIHTGQADVPGVPSDKPLSALKDGDEVFGLRILATPGHTAGHISVFDPSTGTLVAGDALRTTDGLQGSDPQYTADATQAAASVRKLATLDIKAILPGHGDPLTTGAADALRKLAASLPA
ncbi:MBL fold metallo-hydrolase [Actinoplanes sp. N902-109]|uniref:MBL fold metallo-hydrolase n=1 Tax=Actinoplanes sp. (strain N902-109) TaxID=649831 RepID=UPI00032961F4|nr:MBL fold metallo-hydrolase [Actinoplanes sp. N902-109]AGL17174.1 Glyoxalase II family member [Actinoplanes sp. N902-109]